MIKYYQRFKTPEQRFWEKINVGSDDECWLWNAALTHDGYGRFSLRQKQILSHRLSWELEYGPIPDNLCVCHKCDTPACCNPKHLFVGTVQDNVLDKFKKGRNVTYRGQDHVNSKLTEEAVRVIRIYHAHGHSCAALGVVFGVSKRLIGRVCQRTMWAHVQ